LCISSVPIDVDKAALGLSGGADSFLSAMGALILSSLRRPRLRVSGLVEAVAALAIVFAFLNWLWTPAFDEEILGARYTNLAVVGPRVLLASLSAGVILLALFVIASVLFRAVKGENRKLDRWTKGLGLLNLLVVAWFLAIETTVYREACPACFNARCVRECRAFSRVIRRDVRPWNLPTLRELIAADLGTSCRHSKPARMRVQSRIGLCLVSDGGFMWLYDRPVYPPCARAAVRAWLAEDPNLPATFRKRVLEENDRVYWRAFVDRIYDACPDSELPDYLHKAKRSASLLR
jgi:hypothetical protein